MTTVAWDGKTLAADKMTTTNGRPHLAMHGKLHRINYHGQDALAAGSGVVAFSHAVIEWLNAGAPPDHRPEMPGPDDSFSVLVVTEAGLFTYIDSLTPVALGQLQWALGSGGEYALGAMAAGASAKRAVEIACTLDVSSGMGVDTLTLRKGR